MMDDLALQQELEALAGNAFNPDVGHDHTTEPIVQTANRWQHLFNLAQDEAIERIMDHRNNLTKIRVTDDHWDTVRADKEVQGYDKEAYEYQLNLQKKQALLPSLVPAADNDDTVSYLIELQGPLDTPEKVRFAAELEAVPLEVFGRSMEERRQVRLCCIDAKAKTTILHWAGTNGGGFEPTILVDPRSLPQRG